MHGLRTRRPALLAPATDRIARSEGQELRNRPSRLVGPASLRVGGGEMEVDEDRLGRGRHQRPRTPGDRRRVHRPTLGRLAERRRPEAQQRVVRAQPDRAFRERVGLVRLAELEHGIRHRSVGRGQVGVAGDRRLMGRDGLLVLPASPQDLALHAIGHRLVRPRGERPVDQALGPRKVVGRRGGPAEIRREREGAGQSDARPHALAVARERLLEGLPGPQQALPRLDLLRFSRERLNRCPASRTGQG